jgi:hypothetical protein
MIASVVGQEKRVGASTSVLPGYPDRSAYAGRSEALSRASAFFYYVELGVEEEYACVRRGVAGQLATVVLVARRRPDVYKKKGAPRVAVQAAGGLIVGKRIWRCLSRGSPWWGKRLLASRC